MEKAKIERAKQVLKNMQMEREKYKDNLQDFHHIVAQCDPDYLELYDKFYNAALKDKALPAKMKEMMLVVECACKPEYEGMWDDIKMHMTRAKRKGATKEEMAEAVYTLLYTVGVARYQKTIYALRDVYNLTQLKLT